MRTMETSILTMRENQELMDIHARLMGSPRTRRGDYPLKDRETSAEHREMSDIQARLAQDMSSMAGCGFTPQAYVDRAASIKATAQRLEDLGRRMLAMPEA